ncbi:PRC-barrel domain containing protein [Haloplanus halophilus]|uniref:PRC-barrel domain containing protein n=1 Tax=Haloplanus halophilus TaxID=2949993 RepID=UPI00203F2787|nr:PRC-barrel domain containing protein [Haloplanus sp. GDY1]
MASVQITDDHVGASVVDGDGDDVGIVSAVEHGTAYVEPDPGLAATLKAKLGWEDTDDDAYPLQEEAIETVTDDEIRLRSDL